MARSSNLNVQITGDSRSLSKATKDAGGALDKLGKQTAITARVTQRGFSSIGVAARGAAAASVAAAAGFAALGKKVVSTASDINESLTKNQVLFGKHADAIDKWSKQTAASMGISRAAALEATGTFGNLFTALEIGPKKSADMSTALVKLAADMASFNNASPEDALEAIRSGLVGETEPLRKFGVNMNDATLRAEALSMGLVKSTKESLDPQTRALAANALIMKQTASAHGDFARTSGGLANQTRILKARLSDLAGSIGTALLPAAQSATKWINRLLGNVKSGKGTIGGFANALADVPGKLAEQFNKLKDDPRGPGAAIGAMIIAGIDKIDWAALGKKVSEGFNSALKIGGKVGSAIVDAFQQVPWDKVGDAIGKGVEGSLNFADTLPQKISDGLSMAVSKVNGRQVLGKLVDILGEAIDALFSPSFWIDHFKGIFATVTLVIPIAKILKLPGANLLFKLISKPVFEAIGFLGKGMLSLFGKAASEAGVSFLSQLEKVLPRTANLLLRLVTGSGKALASLPGKLAGIASDAADAVARKLGSATGTIAGKITGWIISGVKALGKLVGRVAQEGSVIGRSILAGILAGLGSLGHVLLQKVKEAVGFVAGKVKGIAGSIGSALNPFGDGIGRPSSSSIPAFGGSLMGARPSMAPVAGIGSRFGLRVSSGRRPGAITSSGNVSYHSTGEALDEAGTPQGMAGFFRYMKRAMGGRLAELIYTGPGGGTGIKNGRPFTYTGQVAADHHDHVHVAIDSGAPGVGDGIGQIKSLWTRAGGSSSAQNIAAAISMAESGGNPNASHKNADGSIDRGLWQINSVHGGLSTFDRLGNAKAAVSISGNGRNWNPWTVFKTGAYKRFLSAAGKAPSSKGGSPGKPPGKSVPTIGGSGIPSKPPTYDQIDTALGLAVEEAGGQDNPAALNALVNQRAALSDRAAKIRAALRKKGLRPATRARLQAELAGLVSTARQMDAQIGTLRNPPAADTDSGSGAGTGEDPNQPLIDATNELARIEQQRIDLETQVLAGQAKLMALAQQGPEILAAVIAAVNGGIGGQVGLGLQTPGYAGAVANYGGSAGRL